MGLYDYIPDNRWITREELVRITGFSDRKVRDGISELRKDPKTMVVSSSHGKGYKRPSNVEEMKTCLNEINSHFVRGVVYSILVPFIISVLYLCEH